MEVLTRTSRTSSSLEGMTKPDTRHPANNRHWILAYDISNASRRRRVARLLLGQTQRIQRSVYTTCCTQREAVALLQAVAPILQEGDRFVAWPIIKHNSLQARWKDREKASRLPAYWMV
jgi:CRISPR-associated endonuclease Cas2